MATTEEFSPLSPVELHALGSNSLYPPMEHIPVIVVDSFPILGRLTALRFIEWVQSNPGGVVSLPTGKTPEFFIANVSRFLNEWDSPKIQEELSAAGIDVTKGKPNMHSLHFIQIDEFYPMDPTHKNSFFQ